MNDKQKKEQTMKQIKNRYTGKVMCGGLSWKAVIEKHVKYLCGERGGGIADLSGADLRNANIRCANLRGAYLNGADLRDADLSNADLSGANLRGAYLRSANLSDANLRDAYLRCANLSDANLRDADLSGANLRDADLSECSVKIKDIHKTVYAAASKEGALDMQDWHCGTSHCRAGWVVELAGEGGKALERAIGTSAAAAMIYMASDPKLEKVPDFYASNEGALEDMKRLAGAK